jgi:hypothetical protein
MIDSAVEKPFRALTGRLSLTVPSHHSVDQGETGRWHARFQTKLLAQKDFVN